MFNPFGSSGGADAAAELDGSFTPPECWSFPPFFTLQPVAATRDKQLTLWTDLVLDWAKTPNTWSMALHKCPLWENPTISRRLSDDGMAAVVAHLIAKGHAEWETGDNGSGGAAAAAVVGEVGAGRRLRIMWKTVANVANELIAHARENGMIG